MKKNQCSFTKFITYFAIGIMLFLFSVSKVSASVFSPVYSTSPPANYQIAPSTEQYVCGNWSSTCWNSWAPNQTDCGTACAAGEAWTKYIYSGCYYDIFDPENYLPVYLTTSDLVCSTADKYNSDFPSQMNSGKCDCSVGGRYKTCCNEANQVPAVSYSIQDPYPPDEAVCPTESSTILCGSGYPTACGQAACNTLVAPTSTPTPTPEPGDPTPTSAPPTSVPPITGGILPPLLRVGLRPVFRYFDLSEPFPDSISISKNPGDSFRLNFDFNNANNIIGSNADLWGITLTWTMPTGLTITGASYGCTIDTPSQATCSNLYPYPDQGSGPMRSMVTDFRYIDVSVNSGATGSITIPRAKAVFGFNNNPHYPETGRYPGNEWGRGFTCDSGCVLGTQGYNQTYTFETNTVTVNLATAPTPTPTPEPVPAPTGLDGLCPNPGSSANLSWNSVSGATSYSTRVQNTRTGTYSEGSRNSLPASPTSYSFTSTKGDSYTWQIWAEKSGMWSNPSSSDSFLCTPPAPENLQGSCSVTSASMTWNAANGATAYDIRVYDNADNLLGVPFSKDNITLAIHSFTGTAGATYKWKVWAKNSAGYSDPSIQSTFSCPVSGQAPTPSITKPSCITAAIPSSSSQLTISWTNNATPVTYVDISEDNFVTYFKKPVRPAGSSSVTAPVEFDGEFLDSDGSRLTTETLPINYNQDYYVRTFNGSPINYGHSTIVPFFIPSCPTPTPITPTATPGGPIPTPAPGAPNPPTNLNAACSDGGRRITLTWNAPVGGALFYSVKINGTVASSRFAEGISPPPPYSTNINPDQPYTWSIEACNTNAGVDRCSFPPTNGLPFTCSSEAQPWIFVDGDVHSNTGINMPGGPPL